MCCRLNPRELSRAPRAWLNVYNRPAHLLDARNNSAPSRSSDRGPGMDFHGHSETFYTRLVDDSGSEDVSLNLSIDGLKVMDRSGRFTKRKIPLDHITRWTRSTDKLTMFVKSPVDIEEKPVSFYSSHGTLTSLLDSLTSFCLQLVEIMEAKQNTDMANEMRAVAKNGGRRYKHHKNADEVEFWHSPDKAGWLHSQGEVIKTWRKRWFVLKDGYLFRFLDDKVTATSKPRGIVDLSKADDVSSGQSVTNRANTIKVSRIKGFVVYMAESETEMVEWMSALEGTVSRLLKIIAGCDDEDEAPPPSHSSASHHNSMLAQAEQSFKQRAQQPSWSESQQQRSSFGVQGSANYPGVAPLPTAPQVPAYRTNMDGPGMAGSGGVYRDELGVQYGLGGGHSIPGFPGARMRPPQQQDGGGMPTHLPSTIAVTDQAYSSGQHQPPAHHHQPPAHHQPHHVYEPPKAQLPDTVNVMSIMDQPPSHQPSYGVGGGGAHGYRPQPMQQPAPQPAPASAPAPPPQQRWDTLYTPEGRPYYHNPATGATSWEPPR